MVLGGPDERIDWFFRLLRWLTVERYLGDVAILMHCASMLINLAIAEVYGVAANPAEVKGAGMAFIVDVSCADRTIRLHKRPTPGRARRRVVYVTRQLYYFNQSSD